MHPCTSLSGLSWPCVLTGAVLSWGWLVLGHHLARPLTLSRLALPGAGHYCVVATGPQPPTRSMLVNLSLRVQPLQSPEDCGIGG